MFFPMINFEVNVYHVAAELVIQEVSCHMSRKQIEQDPTVGALMMGNMSTAMMRRWRKDKLGSCCPPGEPPCRASRPWPATATGSPAAPSTQPGQ